METEKLKEIRRKEVDQFGLSRSHDASKAAYDLCKVMAQSCLLINGGAATAVLALLETERPSSVLCDFVPYARACYAIGAALSAMTYFRS
jgi:hypothetical protein